MTEPRFFYVSSPHPCFAQPSADMPVWRYMSLPKFVSLLHRRSLHFARADQLGDPFEGSWARYQPDRELMMTFSDHPELEPQRRKVAWQAARESIAISCWHAAEHESAGMWSQYGNGGISIRSTFGGLVGTLPKRPDSPSAGIYVGMVKYIDYATQSVPEGNVYWPFIHKRLSFAHEREVRAIILKPGDQMVDYPALHTRYRSGGIPESGVEVPIDLSALIESVYVAPAAPNWFADTVRAIVSKFDLSVTVVHSSLDDAPFV